MQYFSMDPKDFMFRTNLPELKAKDQEYTKKANAEGKPYYLWNTDLMAAMILNDGIEENDEIESEYSYVAYWLAHYMKFIEDEDILQLCLDFYNKGIHYYNKIVDGRTMYMNMRGYHSTYIWTLCYMYIKRKELPSPEFLKQYRRIASFGIFERKVSEDGHSLIKCTEEESKKACSEWISPEENEQIKEQLKIKLQKYKEELYKKGELPEIYLKDIKPD